MRSRRRADHVSTGDPIGTMHSEPVGSLQFSDRVGEAHQDQRRAGGRERFDIVIGHLEIDEVAAEFRGQAAEELYPKVGDAMN